MKFLLPLIAFLFFQKNLAAQIVINEVSAANMSGLADEDGDRQDWVELHNKGAAAVNLGGWFLSDNPAKPQKWAFQTGATIAPGGYRVIFCSGKNKQVLYLHTNFKITQTKGEPIILSQPNGTTADIFTFDIPNQGNHSYGRSPNGGPDWKIFTAPTPTAPNGATAFLKYSPKVKAALAPGFYPASQSVALTTGAGFDIRFTTDGSEPTTTSTLFSGPVNIAATTVLKARAFSPDPQILPGFVMANTYFINENHAVPVLSIASNTIFTLMNGSTGAAPIGSFEYFENGKRESDAYGEFNKHGNDSWAYPQRGIDWITRDQLGYDDELDHQFFPERDRTKFQRLILKAAANDNFPSQPGGAHIRDSYVHTLAIRGGMNMDARTHRACVLYVNGQYWGVYDLREKVDDHDFTDHYYGQAEKDIDFIKTWGSTWLEYGTGTDWYALKNYIIANNMTVAANYNYVEQRFDLLSLVDYIILNQHTVCKDWLNWNTAWWRGRDPNGGAKKWRYALWDMDATFGHYTNYTGIPNVGPSADPCDVEAPSVDDPQGHIDVLVKLFDNPNFKALYINRYADLLNTTLSCANMNALLDELTNEIKPEMARHCARWGGSVATWQNNVKAVHDFINARCATIDNSVVDCYDVTGPFDLTVKISPAASPNQVGVNTITPTAYPYYGEYFGGINISLAAKPAIGWAFDHWEVSGNTFAPNQLAAAIALAFATDGEATAFFILIDPCAATSAMSFTHFFEKNCDAAMVGVDTVFLKNAKGCDSLVITKTGLANFSQSNFTAKTCNPALVGTDTLLLKNHFGCDSLVIKTTSFDPAGIDFTFFVEKNCDPAAVGIDTAFLKNGFGCDSLVVKTTVFAGLEIMASTSARICFAEKTGQIQLDSIVTADGLPVSVSLENGPPQTYLGKPLLFENLGGGIYSLSATNADGCTDIREIEIEESSPLSVDLGLSELTIHRGDSILVEPVANFPIATAEWSPAVGVNCATCPATFINSEISGKFSLLVFDAGGCSATASLNVRVELGIRAFVPTAIHPGSGGPNEFLTVFAGPEVVRVRSLRIFDRSGNQIFQQKNLAPNSPCDWDGTYRGRAVPPGVLVWWCELETVDGEMVVLKGAMTVVR